MIVLLSKGEDKIAFLLRVDKILKLKNPIYYKIDVFRTSKKNKPAMLLYSTGSKQFNINMRNIAKKMGYKLNQEGLFKNNKQIILKTEKDFFKKLKMQYLFPEKRK